jgi:hypothetical protein
VFTVLYRGCWNFRYCHVLVARRGVWIGIGVTEQLQIVITSNQNALTNSHTLFLTTAHATFSIFTSRCLVTAPNNIFCLSPHRMATVSQVINSHADSQLIIRTRTPMISQVRQCTLKMEIVMQSQSYFTTGGLPPISLSWRQAS